MGYHDMMYGDGDYCPQDPPERITMDNFLDQYADLRQSCKDLEHKLDEEYHLNEQLLKDYTSLRKDYAKVLEDYSQLNDKVKRLQHVLDGYRINTPQHTYHLPRFEDYHVSETNPEPSSE